MNEQFNILSMDEEEKQIVIDWGYMTLNHEIPLQILENPNMPEAEMMEHIESMRPPEPVNLPVPETLKNKVPKPKEPTAQEKLEEWRRMAAVSAAQAFTALDNAGYLDDIEKMMQDPTTPKKTRIAWDKVQEFRRNSPILLHVATEFGISDVELDTLFTAAQNIEL